MKQKGIAIGLLTASIVLLSACTNKCVINPTESNDISESNSVPFFNDKYPFFPRSNRHITIDYEFDDSPVTPDELYEMSDYVVTLKLTEYKDFHIMNIKEHADINNVLIGHGYTEYYYEIKDIQKGEDAIQDLRLCLFGMPTEVYEMGYYAPETNLDECYRIYLGDTFKFYLKKYGSMCCSTSLNKSIYYENGKIARL